MKCQRRVPGTIAWLVLVTAAMTAGCTATHQQKRGTVSLLRFTGLAKNMSPELLRELQPFDDLCRPPKTWRVAGAVTQSGRVEFNFEPYFEGMRRGYRMLADPDGRAWFPACVRDNVSILLQRIRDTRVPLEVRVIMSSRIALISGLQWGLTTSSKANNQELPPRLAAWWDAGKRLTEEKWQRECLSNLVSALKSGSVADRAFAAQALFVHTGLKFGFNPAGPAQERRKACTRWDEWARASLHSDKWLREATKSPVWQTRVLAAWTAGRSQDADYGGILWDMYKRDWKRLRDAEWRLLHDPGRDEGRARILKAMATELYSLSRVWSGADLLAAMRTQPLGPHDPGDLAVAQAYVMAINGDARGLELYSAYLSAEHLVGLRYTSPWFDGARIPAFKIALLSLEYFCEPGVPRSEWERLRHAAEEKRQKEGGSAYLARMLATFEADREYAGLWKQWVQKHRSALVWDKQTGTFEFRPASEK